MREQYLAVYDRIENKEIKTLTGLRNAVYHWYDLTPCPGWSTFWFMTIGEVWDDFNIPTRTEIDERMLEEVLYKMNEIIDSIRDIQERGFK